jgi:hypothetical protein
MRHFLFLIFWYALPLVVIIILFHILVFNSYTPNDGCYK